MHLYPEKSRELLASCGGRIREILSKCAVEVAKDSGDNFCAQICYPQSLEKEIDKNLELISEIGKTVGITWFTAVLALDFAKSLRTNTSNALDARRYFDVLFAASEGGKG
jgi:hypothetical protein